MKSAIVLVVSMLILQMGYANTLLVLNTNDSGASSFRDAATNALDGDTIRFHPGLLASGNDTIKLFTSIGISKKVTVKGLFTATDTLYISGQNLIRILTVGFSTSAIGTKNIVLDSLALINGNVGTGQGACLYVGAVLDTLFLSNSIIRNGQAKHGGGMYCGTTTLSTAKPPQVVISNSKFQNNAATDFGGGICTYFAKIKTINCSLSGNTAERGGGIYFHSKYVSEVLFTEVVNNDATAYGGGFYSHFTDTVLVSNSYFYGNYAFYNGGAMNSAGKLDVVKTVVDSNSAGTRAGGIYFAYFGTVMTVDSSMFTRNDATFGGAVNAQSAMNFNYTTFDNNTGSQGPGLYFTSATVNVLGCTFSNNVGSTGGGINVGQNASIDINKSTIVNNTVSGLGGGIYCYNVYNTGTFSIRNSTVSGNSAPFGGGVSFRTSSVYPLNASFESSIIAGNGPLNIRAYNDTITSLGYNVFGDTTVFNSISTDQVFVSDSALSLHALGYFGGYTQTAPPSLGSVAINAGNPMDISSAQNGVLTGIRDVGAAEAVGIFRDTITACTHYFWYQNAIANSGDYVKLLPNGDTVATLNLTIIPFTSGTDVITACSVYTWTNGITYTASNSTAIDTLVNAIGCDSIVTLNLTIIPPIVHSDTVTACDSYTWINNVTYVRDTVVSDTLVSSIGCDSIINLHLTIHATSGGIEEVTACDSYTWINGLTYTTSNSTATDTLINVNGCDSVVTLHLTILASSSSTDHVLTCAEDFTWTNGITYTASNNSATDTLQNTQGCDSVITLNLTIHHIDTAVQVAQPTLTAQAAFASYQWLDCQNNFAIIPGETAQQFTATTNGSYAVQITELGCVDTSACVTFTTIGVAENTLLPTILVYPNPVKNILHIEKLWPNGKKKISLKNTLGQVVIVFETMATETEINVELLPVGMYILNVTAENGSYSQKVVVGDNG